MDDARDFIRHYSSGLVFPHTEISPADILIAQNYLRTNRNIPTMKEDEDYTAYYNRLRNMWEGGSKVKEVHCSWMDKIKRFRGPLERHFKERKYTQIKKLFESNFLRNDYIDTGMPREDCEDARNRLKIEGWESLLDEVDGADWKLALLISHLLRSGQSLLCDEDNAGYYINDMRKKLTWDDLEAFFRFDASTHLLYADLKVLNGGNEQDENNEEGCDGSEVGDNAIVPVIFDKRINERKVISQIKLLSSEKVTGKRRWYVFYRVFKYLEWTKVTQKEFIEWVAYYYGWDGKKEFRGVQTEFINADPPQWYGLVIEGKDGYADNTELGPEYYAFAKEIRDAFIYVDDNGVLHDKDEFLVDSKHGGVNHHKTWI